jgi:transposase-like protein
MRKHWSTEEKAYITEHFANTKTEDLAKHFGVTYHQLFYEAKKLGLTKSAAFTSSLMPKDRGVAKICKRCNIAYKG